MVKKRKKDIIIKKHHIIISAAIIILSVVWLVVQFLILPENISVQASFSEIRSDKIPRIIAVIVPFVISLVSSMMYLLKGLDRKYLSLSVIGLLLPVMNILINI